MAPASTSQNGSAETPSESQNHAVDIRYFVITLLSAMIVFFVIGFYTAPIPTPYASINFSESTVASTSTPNPVKRTEVKHSNEIGSKITSNDLNEHHVNFQEPSYEYLGEGEGIFQRAASSKSSTSVDKDQEEHLPAGQHLLVDIKNVSAKFLNSEQRLAQAMVDTVKQAGLTLLSYHCHSLVPAGVSCVGVLLESHISFHTWPEEGVITLDLFTCGEKPLLPIVPVLEELFGVPRKEDGEGAEDEEIVTLWSHELRGFRYEDPSAPPSKMSYLNPSKSDLAYLVLSPLDLYSKKHILTTESKHHRIDIWDTVDNEDRPTYFDAIKHNLTKDDPRWKTPEIVTPNRALFMNGVLKVNTDFNVEFHESLVHPAMIAHPRPVNVAVIGGGHGAVVREVLKYESVESITVVELDEMIFDIVKKYLPALSDCSNIVGVAENCFDDKRVHIINDDAVSWFIDRFGNNPSKESPVEKFDVIIMDVDDIVEKQRSPFYEKDFISALTNSLSEDGTLANSLGDPHSLHDPRAEFSEFATREAYMQVLENDENVSAMFVYEEAHLGEEDPAAFLTVCKSSKCRESWFADVMVIDYEIKERMRETKDEAQIVFHYDGATQYSFQIPPRAWEEVYCRREPRPFECDYRGLDPTKDLFEMELDEEGVREGSSFEIKWNDNDVTSIFATEDIPEGSYIMPTDVAASFTISETTHNNLKSNLDIQDTGNLSVIQNFLDFIEEHGHKTVSDGSTLKYVEVGGSSLIRKSDNADEINVGRWMPEHPSGMQPKYSPVYDRHMVSYDVFIVATKDIKKGEELVKPKNLWS